MAKFSSYLSGKNSIYGKNKHIIYVMLVGTSHVES